MQAMPRILGLGTANPPTRYTQREIYDFAARHVDTYRNRRVEQIFMSSDIDFRYLAFDLATLDPQETADDLHRRFAEHSLLMGVDSIQRCLTDAGLTPSDVDYIVAVSCTGYLCPGLSAILSKNLGMRNNLQRADLVGMGCAGAMPGLQRAYEYVRAYPDRKALVVTVEVCSACYYVDDSLETVVGNAICADGSAAVVIGHAESPVKPALMQFETLLEPSYIDTVGFQFKSGKLRIVLSKDIRAAAGGLADRVIRNLLDHAGIRKDEVTHWIVHSGGRKVIDNIKDEVGLAEEQLASSRRVLREYGNMSSPTVLFVLADILANAHPRPGDLGVMLALGPGLAVESGLVRW